MIVLDKQELNQSYIGSQEELVSIYLKVRLP